MDSQLPVNQNEPTSNTCCRWNPLATGVAIGLGIAGIAALSFLAGAFTFSSSTTWNGIPRGKVPSELLQASATHGGANMAICTGQVDDDSEGFFALDFVTGDLKCWVYYPRQQAFGGMFMTNVQAQLGMSKNAEYLLVTGGAAPISLGGNVRPAASLVYVVDVRSGYFVAYTIPWNRTAESSAAMQGGQMLVVGSGQIREPQGGGKKPPVPPKKGPAAPGAGAANGNLPAGNDPNAPANPANPGAPAVPGAGKQNVPGNPPNPNNRNPR